VSVSALSGCGRSSSGLLSASPDGHSNGNSDNVSLDLSDPDDIALVERSSVGNSSEECRSSDNSEGLHFDGNVKKGLKE